jgi:hypothetical protein
MENIFLLNKSVFSTFSDADAVFEWDTSGDGNFVKVFYLKDFTESDQKKWTAIGKLFDFDPTSIPLIKVSFQDFAVGYVDLPQLAQPEPGKFEISFGVKDKDPSNSLSFGVEFNKGCHVTLASGKKLSGFFDEDEYPDPQNTTVKIKYPIIKITVPLDDETSDGSEDILVALRVRTIASEPRKVEDREPGAIYYDHNDFKIKVGQGYNKKVATKYIDEPYTPQLGVSISYLFSHFFEHKAFPNKGIMIPVTKWTKTKANEYGQSAICTVDFSKSFVVGSDKFLPEFKTYIGSQKKGFSEISSSEVTSVFIGGSHNGFNNLDLALAEGHNPTKEKPFWLWIRGMGKEARTVPKHMIMKGLPQFASIPNPTPVLEGSKAERVETPVTVDTTASEVF